MRTVAIFVYVGILAVLNAKITRIPQPKLPFETPAEAREYAIAMCQSFKDYFGDEGKVEMAGYGDVEAYEAVYGPKGHIYDDDTVFKVDDGDVSIGYDLFLTTDAVVRNIITLSFSKSCTADVARVEYGDYWIQYTSHGEVALAVNGNDLKSTKASTTKWIFNPETNTVIIGTMITTGKYGVKILNAALRMSTTVVSAAEYIGLIDEQIKGTNKNIQMISNALFGIIILMGLMFTCVIALCVNNLMGRRTKRYIRYVSTDTESV